MPKIKDKILDLKYKKKLLEEKNKNELRNKRRNSLFNRIRVNSNKLFHVNNTDILFDINEISGAKTLDIPIDVITKIDYSNVNFDNVYIRGINFKGMKNVVINPQTINKKDLRDTILYGVTIIGSLDDTYITRADFTGSRGAFLDPTRVYDKDISGTNLSDVVVVNNFKDVKIDDTIFGNDEMIIDIKESNEYKNVCEDVYKNKVLKKTRK